MGEVFKATDTRLSRAVAIKVLSSSQSPATGAVERFIQEARAASALNHPNIVTIYDIGAANEILYIVMELIEGRTLRDVLAAGPLPTPELLAFAMQIGDALAAAHAKGIAHRDVKPANIMITPDARAKILDFGLAKLIQPLSVIAQSQDTVTQRTLTRPGTLMGTFGYMAPEQARGEPSDFRADQFSLGAVLYEMATGRRAFRAASGIDMLAAILRDNPEPIGRINPQAPAPLQWVVERCLAKDPRDRYPTTRELVDDLAAIKDGVTQARATTAHNLPAQLTLLVGRDRELASARRLALLAHVRLITLTGPGGIGKTRLAVELGRALLQEFPGGVYWIPLESIGNPELVPSEIATVLNIPQTAGQPVTSSLKKRLKESSDAPILLLLDNLEHVLSAAPLVAELLSACERLKVIVTSRATLHVYGEYEFPVLPLATPDPKGVATAAALAEFPAVALFLQRAAALRAGSQAMDDAQIRLVSEICARLEGLPLSIELAAARTKTIPLRSLLDRMRDPLGLLAGGPRDLPPRQQTLRATLDWSHNLLDAEQQRLFRRLAVFVGGVTPEAVEAVCNAKEDFNANLPDAIASLVDNSLLRPTCEEAVEPRFGMLETIREYGLTRLVEAGEEAFTRRAHAAYFLVLAEEGEKELSGPRQVDWFKRFDAEISNFRTALDWLTASGEAQWALRLATALGIYWAMRGLAMEGRERLLTLLAMPGSSPRTKLRALALAWAGDLAIKANLHLAEAQLDESLDILEELQDTPSTLRVINSLAVLKRERGEYDAARTLFERAVKVAQVLGEPLALAGALSNLADHVKLQGDYELALLLHAESMRLFANAGDRIGVAWSLSHQADVAREQGDAEQAHNLYDQALSGFRAVDHRPGLAACFNDLAAMATDVGDYVAAQCLYQKSLQLFWDLGQNRNLPHALEAIACCAAHGEPERALALAGSAAALRKALAMSLPDPAKNRLEQNLDAARQALTGSAATASWMRGWSMPIEEAVQLAMGNK